MIDSSYATIKILVVDDEPNIRNLVSAYLKADGFQVFSASDGNEGLESAQQNQPDFIILDVLLPGMDGIQLLTQLRRESDAYVIMLTAKTEEIDKVLALSVGADDYLTKPFSPRELVARIKAALRRMQNTSQSSKSHIITSPHLRIDTNSRQVWLDDQPIELTTTEFDLLATLAQHRGMVLTREQLLEKIWGNAYYGEIRVVDVHLGHIRKKLEPYEIITTVRGFGYRFEAERS